MLQLYYIKKKKGNSLYSVTFSTEDILNNNNNNNLDSNKTHGHKEISVRMLKYVVPPSVDY